MHHACGDAALTMKGKGPTHSEPMVSPFLGRQATYKQANTIQNRLSEYVREKQESGMLFWREGSR